MVRSISIAPIENIQRGFTIGCNVFQMVIRFLYYVRAVVPSNRLLH